MTNKYKKDVEIQARNVIHRNEVQVHTTFQRLLVVQVFTEYQPNKKFATHGYDKNMKINVPNVIKNKCVERTL